MDFLRGRLGQAHGGRILDFGAGRGQSIRVLISSFLDYTSIVGVDTQDSREGLDQDLLENPKVTCLKFGGLILPLDDDAFDTVGIANVLHHLKPTDIGIIIAENLRVLTPDGRLVVMETVCDGLSEAQMSQVHFHHWRAEIDRLMGREHNPTFTRSELHRLVSSFGLRGLEIGEHVPSRDDCNDPKHLEELAEYMDRQLDEVRGHPEYGRLKARYDELVRRMHRTGFLGATTMIFIGRKR